MVRTLRIWVTTAIAVTVLGAGWATRAQEQKTTTEKIKDSVGGAVSSVKKGVASAEEKIKEQYAKAKDAVVGMNIEARVYARLHWDKALAGSKVELHAPKAGVIELTGTVSDAKAQARAVELTNDTVGVTEVINHLSVMSSAVVK